MGHLAKDVSWLKSKDPHLRISSGGHLAGFTILVPLHLGGKRHWSSPRLIMPRSSPRLILEMMQKSSNSPIPAALSPVKSRKIPGKCPAMSQAGGGGAGVYIDWCIKMCFHLFLTVCFCRGVVVRALITQSCFGKSFERKGRRVRVILPILSTSGT